MACIHHKVDFMGMSVRGPIWHCRDCDKVLSDESVLGPNEGEKTRTRPDGRTYRIDGSDEVTEMLVPGFSQVLNRARNE
jgi:hypothetical protein